MERIVIAIYLCLLLLRCCASSCALSSLRGWGWTEEKRHCPRWSWGSSGNTFQSVLAVRAKSEVINFLYYKNRFSLFPNFIFTWHNSFHSSVLLGVCAVIVGLLAWTSAHQTQFWRSDEALWRRSIALDPSDWRALDMYAEWLFKVKDYYILYLCSMIWLNSSLI